MKECCGTCKWHKYDRESEDCSDWTEYGYICEEWEEK